MKLRIGRPPNPANRLKRRHTIVLDEVSEKLFRLVSKNRGQKSWIHAYVSEHIKQDFLKRSEEQIAVQEMLEAQKEMHLAQEKFEQKRSKVSKIKNKLAMEEHSKELLNVGLV